MDDKLTRKSQEALSQAVQRATTAGNPNVDGLHLLAALIEQDGGTAAPLLRAVGADPAAVLKAVNDQLARLPKAAGADMSRVLMEATTLQRKLPQTRGATTSAPETSRQLLTVINTAARLAREDGR